jgi:MOSC domain-containing protein YiiM
MVAMRFVADGRVVAVAKDGAHRFSKPTCPSITLIEGYGVRGDAHAGPTVQHLARMRADPTRPNLRQVHLIPAELFADLAERGFAVGPGQLGENITTAGVDLVALPRGTRLAIGDQAEVEITGLRNPCAQLDGLVPGLMRQLIHTDDTGAVVRTAGVMSIITRAGEIRPGDPIQLTLPPLPHQPLLVV